MFIKITSTKLQNTVLGSRDGSCQIVGFFCSETQFASFLDLRTMQFCVPFVSKLLLCQLSFLTRQTRCTRHTALSCNRKGIDVIRRIYRNTTGISGLTTNLTIEMKVTPDPIVSYNLHCLFWFCHANTILKQYFIDTSDTYKTLQFPEILKYFIRCNLPP